jgi:hypothetical protein
MIFAASERDKRTGVGSVVTVGAAAVFDEIFAHPMKKNAPASKGRIG